MTEEQLALIEQEHRARPERDGWQDRCTVDAERVPCEAARLVTEVRRLQTVLRLSESARGVLVGQD